LSVTLISRPVCPEAGLKTTTYIRYVILTAVQLILDVKDSEIRCDISKKLDLERKIPTLRDSRHSQ
jgi:hypothetical protein